MKNVMKYNCITLAMMATSFSFANGNFAVVVDKTMEFNTVTGTIIPNENTGIYATAKNENNNDQDSGNIMSSSLSIEGENGDLINISTDIQDNSFKELVLEGTWNANINLNFTANDKNNASFVLPEYDGDILVNLKLHDGGYEEEMKTIVISAESWTDTEALYGEWVQTNLIQDWSPELSTHYENEDVLQTKIIDREIRQATGDLRNIGEEYIETETNVSLTQTKQGLLEYWEDTDPIIVSDWTVTEIFQDWSPSATNVYENTTVEQKREVKKERIIQTQEYRPATDEYNITSGNISDTTVVFEYQEVQGELEYWENIGEISCTDWSFDRYSEWTPDASTYARSEQIEQSRLMYEKRDCSGQQYRPATEEYRTANEETEYQDTTETRFVYGTKVDLNNWETKDDTSVGDWSVSQDGSYAYQAINGAPTLFSSVADSYSNMILKGKMRVRSAAGDNDWIGMALGVQDTNNFYLWSWKHNANANSTEKEGHNFAKVTNKSAINWAMDVSKTGYSVMQTKHGTAYGWDHDIYHNFEIHYTPTNVKVYIDGSKVIDVNGTFPEGKVSFFNYSQGQVEYYKISEEAIE